MRRKLHTIALGCQMSAADGDEMAEPFRRRGFSETSLPEQADAILVSTCTVRDHAEHRALSLIGALKPWKEADPSRLLIVAGCAAERLGERLSKRFPHVDLVVGAKSIESFPQLVERALAERFDAAPEAAAFAHVHDEPFLPTGSPATAFVTIMRGCNYSCSYCIVPSVRGRELYRPADEVVEEARRKVAAGAREVMLLGQTVNSHPEFVSILERLDALPELARARFMSPHPYYVDDALIGALTRLRTSCPWLHLPAQSGSDRILKKMRRNYTRAQFLDKVAAARRKSDEIVFSTDIIVGFPTETDEEFEQTLSLVRELQPVSAFCFKYSPRESTESARFADDVPQDVKEQRLGRLNELVDGLTQAAQARQIGKTVQVLAEQPDFGRTRDGFKVRWTRPVEVGRLVEVKVTSAARRTLLGELS